MPTSHDPELAEAVRLMRAERRQRELAERMAEMRAEAEQRSASVPDEYGPSLGGLADLGPGAPPIEREGTPE